MALSIDVVIAKDDLKFPSRCVVCGSDVGREQVVLRGNPVGFHGVIAWMFRRTKKLQVPAHMICGVRLSRTILFRALTPVFIAPVAIVLALWMGLSKWPCLGLAIVASIAPIVWWIFHPLPFEFTHQYDEYKLMFKDASMAHEVAAMNDGVIEDV